MNIVSGKIPFRVDPEELDALESPRVSKSPSRGDLIIPRKVRFVRCLYVVRTTVSSLVAFVVAFNRALSSLSGVAIS